MPSASTLFKSLIWLRNKNSISCLSAFFFRPEFQVHVHRQGVLHSARHQSDNIVIVATTAKNEEKGFNDTTMSFPAPAKSSIVTYPTGNEVFENEPERRYKAITEGLASILLPYNEPTTEDQGKDTGNGRGIKEKSSEKEQVFYNPIQNFNRDLSVLVIKEFAKMHFEEKERKNKEKKKENEASTTGEDHDVYIGDEEIWEQSSAPSFRPPHSFNILDALCASGLRALRYSLEIPLATLITANDLSQNAYTSITRNISYNRTIIPNGGPVLNKIHCSLRSATAHMYSNPSKYNVIDLDPYGTAVPFIDSALQSLIIKAPTGGLLCVTCTDAGVWASTAYAEKCFALYGGQPMKGEHCHEVGVRLILNSIASAAGRYGMAIEPLLSLSIDFYSRVFVRVWKSPAQVKHLASNTMLVYNCDSGCSSNWICTNLGRVVRDKTKNGGDTLKYKINRAPTTPDGCQFCGFPMHIGGPMWSGPLHKPEFLTSLLSSIDDEKETNPEVYFTLPRVRGMIQTALSESTFHLPSTPHPLTSSDGSSRAPEPPLPPVDPPHFFHIPTVLSKTLHTEAPSLSGIRGALLRLGYKVSPSHCKPNSVKTTAPTVVIWEAMRSWCNLQQKKHPEKRPNIKEGMPGWNILYPSEEWVSKNAEWKTLREWLQKKREELGGNDPIAFDEELGKDEDKGKFVRYQQNPTANWGPMRAAKVRGLSLLSKKDDVETSKGKRKVDDEGDGTLGEIEIVGNEEKKLKYDVSQ